jgi:ABC-type nitrate/sulfonate/bicarbonate transport system substrate-binding protein
MAAGAAAAAATRLRVGGVPEHFNLPWRLAVERGLFRARGLEVEFVEQPLGTAQMVAALQRGELDVAAALTEGLVAAIATGAPLRIFASYVQTPLRWAVAVGASARARSLADLRGARFGVSRLGSGSHLMAALLAEREGWLGAAAPRFVECGDFAALRKAAAAGEVDAFLWELFMCKPAAARGELRFVGELPSPWPCFMLAAPRALAQVRANELRALVAALAEAAAAFRAEAGGASLELLVREFRLSRADAAEWLAAHRIAPALAARRADLAAALAAMRRFGFAPPSVGVSETDE